MIAAIGFIQQSSSASIQKFDDLLYMGCYYDKPRMLSGTDTKDDKNTASWCAAYCSDTSNGRNYRFFGIESEDECFCGNSLHSDWTKNLRDDSECNHKCKKDEGWYCGGGWKIQIYDRMAADNYIISDNPSGGKCSGGSVTKDAHTITSQAECERACNTLGYTAKPFQVGTWDHSPGCFFYKGNRKCHWNTKSGVGWTAGTYHLEVCLRDWSGDQYQVPGATHLGCFEDTNDKDGDDKSFRILQGANYDLDTTNSPHKCKGVCKDYAYFGVESGQECWCGNELFGKETVNIDGTDYLVGKGRKEGDCKEKCKGDSQQICGDHWRMNLYKMSAASDEYQVSGQINGCSPAEGSKITTEAQCKEACNSLGVTGEFSAGTWNYCPGCFYYTVNGNCHWNTRTDVKWNHANHFEVCKKKEEDWSTTPLGEKCWTKCGEQFFTFNKGTLSDALQQVYLQKKFGVEGYCDLCNKGVCCKKMKNKWHWSNYGNDGCTADVGGNDDYECVKPTTKELDLSYIKGEDGITMSNWNEVRKYAFSSSAEATKNTWLTYRGMKWEGELEKELKLDCGSGQALYWLFSFFDYESGRPVWDKSTYDRRFAFRCKDGVEASTCTWSTYKNEFRQKLDFRCPNDYTLSGLESIFDGSDGKDRRWKIKCCKVADVKVESEDGKEAYSGLETIESGKCTKKLIAHRRGPMNYRVDGRKFIVGMTEVNMYGDNTYIGKHSDDREWYIWECPMKFVDWCVIRHTTIDTKINPPQKKTTQVVGIASAIGCNPEVGYGIRLSQVNAVVNDVSYSISKSESSSLSTGWSVTASAEVGFELFGNGAKAKASASYGGSSTATVSASTSNGEAEGFSDGKYSLHLYMYYGPGATICWATRDKFIYKQDVTTTHHMTCYKQNAQTGAIDSYNTTKEYPATIDGNTFGRLVFHSRTLEWNSTYANTPIAEKDLTKEDYEEHYLTQCDQKLADCIQNLNHNDLATDWTGPAEQFEWCRQQWAKDAKTL